MKSEKGFLLVEALVLILILAVGFTAFCGVLRQVLKISTRAKNLTEARVAFEDLLFDMESGNRPDLVTYGGQGVLLGGYHYEIVSQEKGKELYQNQTTLTWSAGKESLALDLYLRELGRP